MVLIPQPEDGSAQMLPEGDHIVWTGPMSYCVSVIVFDDLDDTGLYQWVVGYHGSGGIQMVNFESLFAFMGSSRTTKVEIIPGNQYPTFADVKDFRGIVLAALKKKGVVIPSLNVHCRSGRQEAVLDRTGELLENVRLGTGAQLNDLYPKTVNAGVPLGEKFHPQVVGIAAGLKKKLGL